MSSERQGGELEFHCDKCGDIYESHDEDFGSAWSEAKIAGWRARKLGNEWVHACPDCTLND